jgi:cytosine/adenosine deaminase-related metal-dependent hydrolase
MAFALQARVVFPVDRPPIDGGVVTIERDRIVDVGVRSDAAEMIDLGDVALLPGLINTHTHLEFSYLQRPLGSPGIRLVDWIRMVIAERGQANRGSGAAAAPGLAECLLSGATTWGDIATSVSDVTSNAGGELTSFFEVIGFSRARAESAFATARVHIESVLQRRYVHAGISPHAPYTVSPALLRQLVSLASECGLPVAMHIAESAEERELLASGSGPFQQLLDERSMWDADAIPRDSRPLDYLRMLSEAPRAPVIHGNYLDVDEHAFLAAHSDRMSLVYCPRTHAYFGHPTYPLPALLESGVRVALATDSRASNPDLNLLAEMQHVAASFLSVDPQTVLRLGTLAGAEALGRDAEVGSITAGKFANLIAVPMLSQGARSAEDVLGEILASDKRPCGIWIRGNAVTLSQG